MHGRVPRANNRQHVMVAEFDSASGVRIDDAELIAKVGQPRLTSVQTLLEPMAVAGAMIYGHHLALSPSGPYRIKLRIAPSGVDMPVVKTVTHAPVR